MSDWRAIIRLLIPPIVLECRRALLGRQALAVGATLESVVAVPAEPEGPLNRAEAALLQERMDRGDFDFDEETIARMVAAWKIDNAVVPYPRVLREAYASGDAVAMNAPALMDVSYRLPYGIAYEDSQEGKYRDFLRFAAGAGIDFAGATVVDAGAGYGGLLDVLGRTYSAGRLVAVECADSALAHIRRHRPRIEPKLARLDAEEAAFVGEVGVTPDIVLCTEVLEHLRHPDRAVRNLLALRPTRGVALSVPNGRADIAAQHIHFWSPESWVSFLEAFSVEWAVTVGRCPGTGSPGGFDNVAVLKPRSERAA